ncbi:MAG: polymer-forming cytoskeletal protein [Pseudomonadota bacterium]
MFSKNGKPKPSATPPSVVSYDMRVFGDVLSDGDVQIEGAVHGDVKAAALTVGAHAVVKGSVICEFARIMGEVDGEIFARRVLLAKTASVRGDIVHENISIDAGAFIDGRCRRMGEGEMDLDALGDNAAAVAADDAPAPAQ